MSAFDRYSELQAYVGWTDQDALAIQAIGPLITPHVETLIEDFYSEMERHSEASRVITGGPAQIARLKQTLRSWLQELFSGTYDRDYVERRWRVGYRHVEIGLDQFYANAAFSRLRRGICRELEAHWTGDPRRLTSSLQSINTLLDLDLAIIEDAYQTEHERRRAATERLATIGRIAGGIAHELRNPLNVVKTSVYFLLNSKHADENKRRSHLERIERQVGVADGVITALNDFAKLPLPQMQPVSVSTSLQDILELNALPGTIEVRWQIDSQEPTVLGDRSQLGIVFGNLIRNAKDAMPEGGVLTLGAQEVGQEVLISIQDTGPGIAPEHLPHVLEPLYSTKAKGIGLGLSISHDIIIKHQGQLAIESQPGQGARFVVRLRNAQMS